MAKTICSHAVAWSGSDFTIPSAKPRTIFAAELFIFVMFSGDVKTFATVSIIVIPASTNLGIAFEFVKPSTSVTSNFNDTSSNSLSVFSFVNSLTIVSMIVTQASIICGSSFVIPRTNSIRVSTPILNSVGKFSIIVFVKVLKIDIAPFMITGKLSLIPVRIEVIIFAPASTNFGKTSLTNSGSLSIRGGIILSIISPIPTRARSTVCKRMSYEANALSANF